MGKEDTHPTFRLRENEMKFRYCKTAAVKQEVFAPPEAEYKRKVRKKKKNNPRKARKT